MSDILCWKKEKPRVYFSIILFFYVVPPQDKFNFLCSLWFLFDCSISFTTKDVQAVSSSSSSIGCGAGDHKVSPCMTIISKCGNLLFLHCSFIIPKQSLYIFKVWSTWSTRSPFANGRNVQSISSSRLFLWHSEDVIKEFQLAVYTGQKVHPSKIKKIQFKKKPLKNKPHSILVFQLGMSFETKYYIMVALTHLHTQTLNGSTCTANHKMTKILCQD